MSTSQNPRVSSKRFFIISFLPALAYWYLEEQYSIQIAAIGGVALGILEIILEYVFTKHIHRISLFNLFILATLGGLSLLAQEGFWFKLQPAISGVLLGGVLLIQQWRGKSSILWEMMEALNKPLPPYAIVRSLEIHLGYFLLSYGLFMVPIAEWASTQVWLFFKTLGFYLAMLVFMLAEVFFMRLKLKKLATFQHSRGPSASPGP